MCFANGRRLHFSLGENPSHVELKPSGHGDIRETGKTLKQHRLFGQGSRYVALIVTQKTFPDSFHFCSSSFLALPINSAQRELFYFDQ